MQKKIYFGGLPWEIDRIGLLNYVKAVLEGNNLEATYELPFVSSPLVNPNSVLRITDVFVALDRKTRKSRGFGFVTIEFTEDNGDELFENILEMMDQRVMIGIRGPRELIVKEADPKVEGDDDAPSDVSDDVEEDAPAEETDTSTDDEDNSDPAMGLNW